MYGGQRKVPVVARCSKSSSQVYTQRSETYNGARCLFLLAAALAQYFELQIPNGGSHCFGYLNSNGITLF